MIKNKTISTHNLSKDEQATLIKEILNDKKRELLLAMIQEGIYQKEYSKPTNIGKGQAESALGEYQKRIQFLSEHIYIIEEYAREKKIPL